MHRHHHWRHWLLSCRAWLAARLRGPWHRCRHHWHRCRHHHWRQRPTIVARPHCDDPPPLLRRVVQAEQRSHAGDRELGSLTPLPTGKQPTEDHPQTREHGPPPRGRRR
jgi:hypothetical protein